MRTALAGVGRLLAGGILCWLSIRAAAFYRYPFAGGEFHAVFAYPSGTFDTAWGVFLTYLVAAAGPMGLLVLLGHRSAWWALALVASAVCVDAWWQVCSFRYTTPEIRAPAMWLLPAIPAVLLAVACLTDRVRRAALRRRTVATPGG